MGKFPSPQSSEEDNDIIGQLYLILKDNKYRHCLYSLDLKSEVDEGLLIGHWDVNLKEPILRLDRSQIPDYVSFINVY